MESGVWALSTGASSGSFFQSVQESGTNMPCATVDWQSTENEDGIAGHKVTTNHQRHARNTEE